MAETTTTTTPIVHTEADKVNAFWNRVTHRDKYAITALCLLVIAAIAWFVGLAFVASRIGPSEDFGVLIRENNELSLPTWSVRVWEQDFISGIQCHHCHWRKISELCDAQPLLNYVVTKNNALGQPQMVQFNSQMKVKATSDEDDYIHCNFNISGTHKDATLFIFEGPNQPSSSGSMKPEGELAVTVKENDGSYVAIRQITTRWRNDTEQLSWERVNSGFRPSAIATGSFFNLYYGTFISMEYSQNSKGLDKIDFWQFMGEIGGLAFFLFLIYKWMLYVFCFFFRHSGVDRTAYQPIA